MTTKNGKLLLEIPVSNPKYVPLSEVVVPSVKLNRSWWTIILVAYNICLTLAICVLYLSLSSEVNTLRNACKSKVNGTIEVETGCQNYQTVDNVGETEGGLMSSIEMLLEQYMTEDQETKSEENLKKCNTTEDVLTELLGGERETNSRVERAKTSHRRVPVGFAHFHPRRGPGTNYPVQKSINFWHPAEWVDESKFQMDHGNGPTTKVTVQSRGLYYIYSQVTFRDINRYHGYTVFVDDEAHLQCYFENPLSRCTRSGTTGACEGVREDRCAVCYTGGLVYIEKRAKVSVQMIFENRIVSGDKADTFFGLLKVK
ncbi:uncharacterized protein [Apostichopus japonicus]|uniref:uncharacterized protein n=1 Tax=Stichopus japonicus TaxID=307972 RepID=UPI003AB6BF28